MKIRNLIENTEGAECCVPMHGLSFYIETQKHRLLSDVGPGEETLRNAEKLGIDLKQVDTVVLSHGHYDHSGGILPFAQLDPDAVIYMQEQARGAYYAYDGKELGYRYIGIDPELAKLPQVRFLSGDVQIDEELSVFTRLTGCMDRQNAAGRKRAIPATNRYLMVRKNDEYCRDDFCHEQCLVVKEGDRQVLFSGCAHSGILNILDRYEEVYQRLPDVVISGFHLMKKKEYTDAEREEIREIARELTTYPTQFFSCHCTGLEAFDMMKEIMGSQLTYVHCGDEVAV